MPQTHHRHADGVAGHGPHASHGGHAAGRFGTAVHATLHCLLGCSIGELTGLAIGVGFGLGTVITLTLAVSLAFVFGLGLAVLPLMRRHGMSAGVALRTIWFGEVISIAVMELVMNVVDYHIGGVQAGSLLEPVFWIGFAVAVPAGFIAALPVNYWLVGRGLKHCH